MKLALYSVFSLSELYFHNKKWQSKIFFLYYIHFGNWLFNFQYEGLKKKGVFLESNKIDYYHQHKLSFIAAETQNWILHNNLNVWEGQLTTDSGFCQITITLQTFFRSIRNQIHALEGKGWLAANQRVVFRRKQTEKTFQPNLINVPTQSSDRFFLSSSIQRGGDKKQLVEKQIKPISKS